MTLYISFSFEEVWFFFGKLLGNLGETKTGQDLWNKKFCMHNAISENVDTYFRRKYEVSRQQTSKITVGCPSVTFWIIQNVTYFNCRFLIYRYIFLFFRYILETVWNIQIHLVTFWSCGRLFRMPGTQWLSCRFQDNIICVECSCAFRFLIGNIEKYRGQNWALSEK